MSSALEGSYPRSDLNLSKAFLIASNSDSATMDFRQGLASFMLTR